MAATLAARLLRLPAATMIGWRPKEMKRSIRTARTRESHPDKRHGLRRTRTVAIGR